MNTQYNETIQPHTKMLQLNIKSKDYMCLDIDPDSVIHKHLRQKLFSLDKESATQICDHPIERNLHNKILLWNCKGNWNGYFDTITSKHNLTMLPSFHISLGAPRSKDPKWFKERETQANYWLNNLCTLDAIPIIGDITLAPICVSEKNNRKSAWIPLNPHWFEELNTDLKYDFENYDSFDHRCDEYPVQHLHVSVANLTGEPRDSIARPEDCIVDTINN